MRFAASILLLLIGLSPAVHAQGSVDADFEAAYVAWEVGDYPDALRGFTRVLGSPQGERYLARIALITGELYRSDSLAGDGRLARWSGDGRLVAFETGTGAARVSHVVSLDDEERPIASVPGISLAFAPVGGRVAYLKLSDAAELRDARAALAALAGSADRAAIVAQQQMVAFLEARLARIVFRDLASGAETEVADDGLLKTALVFAPDGHTLYFVGRAAGDSATDIYSLALPNGRPVAVTRGPGIKSDPVPLPGGSTLLYHTGRADPFFAPARTPAQGAPALVLRDLATGAARTFPAVATSAAANGSAVAFLTRAEGISQLAVVQTRGGDPVVVKRSTNPIDAPALSPDGATLAFQSMPREDWELYIVRSDGKSETRLTRDIQHDLLPRWISPTRLIAMKGEGRHRRSYLYDVASGTAERLLHNNTVRTIAPEYEWVPSADGSKVLIVAERDGDTVSPERGVFVVDLTRRVTREEVQERLRSNLAAETALRERGRRMFAPIADAVREATTSVSIPRLYEYQKALFDFDSKHVRQPGNQKAIRYLEQQYRSFGYEPELQWFDHPGDPRTANVLATIRGTTNPELVYVVSSHFDSRQEGPGADDNTSGTSVLLEAARILARRPQAATIIFASFTGEEAGLLGSREFVRRAVADSVALVGALNNDMIGWSNDHRLDNTIRYSNSGIRDVQHAAALGFSDLITYDAVYYKNTDAGAYYEVYGDIVGGIGSYPVLANPHYHMPHDHIETINQELVAETAKTTIASIMLLASSPSRLAGLSVSRAGGDALDVSWTPSREKGIRSYLVAHGPPADPLRKVVTVKSPRARLQGVAAGEVVSVKAVNAKGLEGWDWARVSVGR